MTTTKKKKKKEKGKVASAVMERKERVRQC
jgi:hypothetical protein